MRLTMVVDENGAKAEIEVPEGANVFLSAGPDGKALPPGTSLWLNDGRLFFGYHDEIQSDWITTTSVSINSEDMT